MGQHRQSPPLLSHHWTWLWHWHNKKKATGGKTVESNSSPATTIHNTIQSTSPEKKYWSNSKIKKQRNFLPKWQPLPWSMLSQSQVIFKGEEWIYSFDCFKPETTSTEKPLGTERMSESQPKCYLGNPMGNPLGWLVDSPANQWKGMNLKWFGWEAGANGGNE